MFAPKTAASPGLTEGERERVARIIDCYLRAFAPAKNGKKP